MSLPSSVGLPAEMQLGTLDNSCPPDAKSMSIRVLPSNLSTISSSVLSTVASAAPMSDAALQFPNSNIIFDIPCGSSPSMFLDPRLSTLNFRMTITINSVGAVKPQSGYLRSNANSWFDRMYITSQNGQIVEDISEYGLVNDLLIALQMNNSTRDGVANQFGFLSGAGLDNQGHQIGILSTNAINVINTSESHSYSVPILSSLIGVCNDKSVNIGRTSKLQCIFQTTNVCPLTITLDSGSASTFTVTLDNFSLSLEYIDIGVNALQLLDQTLVDSNAYMHGVTYRSSSATIPASTSGFNTLLCGIRASSVKSIFCRFFENNLGTGASCNGKYDSKSPSINQIGFNVGGLKFPQSGIDPLRFPSMAFRELQMAIGSFNNATFNSGITPTNYCKLAAGGTAQAFTAGLSSTQEYSWSLNSSQSALSQFLFGVNTEVVARRFLLSGLNCTSAPIFLECNLSIANTNSITVYFHTMLDVIYIHNVVSGDIQARI